MNTYVYPKLSASKDLLFYRFGGAGLANTLFTYARAIVYAEQHKCKIITPTWSKFSVGTYLRREKDKRSYRNLLTTTGEICGLRKLYYVLFRKCCVVEGMGSYFEELLDYHNIVSSYIIAHIQQSIRQQVECFDFNNAVAVHIRLGDYPEEHRTPINWYKQKIKDMSSQGNYNFLVFSDGTDEELQELMQMPNVNRVFFGNAMADIYAISLCKFLIGSDSTFSGWGAFLGQVPCVFYRKHYGRVLIDSSKEFVEDSTNTWLN